MVDMRRREKVAWVLIFSVPPGIGVTGLFSVMLDQGALSVYSVAAGLVAALVLGGSIAATLHFGPDEDPESRPPDTGGPERARE